MIPFIVLMGYEDILQRKINRQRRIVKDKALDCPLLFFVSTIQYETDAVHPLCIDEGGSLYQPQCIIIVLLTFLMRSSMSA